MKILFYCHSCKSESIEEMNVEPRRTKIGTDGFGQPVRFIDCECGKDKGFMNLDFYTRQGIEIDEIINYLKYRIEMYS